MEILYNKDNSTWVHYEILPHVKPSANQYTDVSVVGGTGPRGCQLKISSVHTPPLNY